MKYLVSAAACITILSLLVLAGDDLEAPKVSGGPRSVATTPPAPEEYRPREAGRTRRDAGARALVEAAEPTAPPADGREVDPAEYESAEKLLADYWKDLWPDVRAELVEAGLDLVNYPYEELKTWTEVRGLLAEHLLEYVENKRAGCRAERTAWSSPASAAEALGVEWTGRLRDRPDVSRVWHEVNACSEKIDALAENLHAGLDILLFDALHDPARSTVHPIGFPRRTLGVKGIRPADYVVAKVAAFDGWAFEVLIQRAEHPEIASWLDELEQLRSRRRRAFESILAE